jgi:hypothetical protein
LRTEPRAPSRNRRAGVQSPETYTVQPGDKIVSSISLSDPSQRAYTMRIKSITEPTKEIVWTYDHPTRSNGMQHAATCKTQQADWTSRQHAMGTTHQATRAAQCTTGTA